MSNPYIQFELDAAKKAPVLASALGIQLREAIGGLTMMWLHVYSEKAHEVSALYLRSFFGVDPVLAGEVLKELGFVEQIDGATWRVRGAGRYTRLSEIRSEAGRKGARTSNERQASKRSANGSKRSANGQQTEPPTNAQDVKILLTKDSSKRSAKGEHGSANEQQSAEKGQQKSALEPRSDSSPPSGERELSEIGRSTSRAQKRRPPPDGGGASALGESSEPQPSAYVERQWWQVPERCHRGHDFVSLRPLGDGKFERVTCAECAPLDAQEAREAEAAKAREDLDRRRRIPLPYIPPPGPDASDEELLAYMQAKVELERKRERGELSMPGEVHA